MKAYLHIMFVSIFLLVACSDESTSFRNTRKLKKNTASTEKKVDQHQIDEKVNEYSKLNLEKIKLKLQYISMKERINKLTYEQAKVSKEKLATLKDDISILNYKLKDIEKELSPADLAEAKYFPETAKQWDNPGITDLSIDSIKTTDGVQYKGVKLIEVCEIGIDIQHSNGVAFLSYEVLSEPIQKECNYNPVAAFEFRKNRSERKKERQEKIIAAKTDAEKKKQGFVKKNNENLAASKTKEKIKSPKLSSASTSLGGDSSSITIDSGFKKPSPNLSGSSSSSSSSGSSGCSPRRSGG